LNEENDILELLTKARESLKAAEMLFDGEFYDFSAGRSYYAMKGFYQNKDIPSENARFACFSF